jgi:hypothetical protein
MDCPACGSSVADLEPKCPGCGYPLREAQFVVMRVYVVAGALMASTLLYVALLFVVPATGHVEPGFLRTMQYTLWSIAAVTAAVVYFWPEPQVALSPQAATTRVTAQGALAETPALYGLMLHFLGAPAAHSLALVAVSAVLFGVIAGRLPRLAQAMRRYLVENHRRDM